MRLMLSSLAAVLIVGLVVTPVSLAQSQPIDLGLEVDASVDGGPPLVHVRATNSGGGLATREFEIAAQNNAGARYPIYSGFFTLPGGGSAEQTFPWSPMDSGPQLLLIVDDETVSALVPGTTVADAPPPPPAPDTPLTVQTTACLQVSGPAYSLNSCPYSIGQSLPARPPTASLDTDRLQAPGRIPTTAGSCEIGRTDPLAAIGPAADTLSMASLGQQALPCCVKGTVKGTVSVSVTSNGRSYPLERVVVRLSGYCEASGAPSPKAVTQLAVTDAQGHYQFTDVPLFRKPTPCDLATKLAYFPAGSDSTGKAPAFAVKYGNENAPTIEGNQAAQCVGDTTTTVDLNWGQGGLVRPGCQTPCAGAVEDLAYLYVDVAQIFDYFTVQLGAKLVHALPVVGFSTISDDIAHTHFDPSTGVLNMLTSDSIERARDQDATLGPGDELRVARIFALSDA